MPHSNSRISASLHAYPQHPLSGLERALALQDPHSFEYKQLMHAYEVVADKKELLTLLLCNLVMASEQEKRDFELQREKRLMHEESQQKQLLEQTREDDERIEQAKSRVHDTHLPKLELEKLLERYQELKQTIDDSIHDIEKRESDWKKSFEATADEFIKTNFKLREDGRLVSTLDETVVFKREAIGIVRKIITDVKSPIDILSHNPDLMKRASHDTAADVMMNAQQVRMQLHMVRKLDKLLDPEARAQLQKKAYGPEGKRIFYVTEVSTDEHGNRVKNRVAKEPHKRLVDPNATDESTKKNQQYTKTLDEVHDANKVLQPAVCSTAQVTGAQQLIGLAPQKNALLEARQACQANIDSLTQQLQNVAAPEAASRHEASSPFKTNPYKTRPEPK